MAKTHGPTDPSTCSKPGCLGGHVEGKCVGHASDGSGKPCGNWPVHGSMVCKKHGAGAPQVRAAAQMRILENADAVAAALVKIALNEKEPASARVTAARDLLDRADLGATRRVAVTHEDLTDEAALQRAQQLVTDEVAEQRAKREQTA